MALIKKFSIITGMFYMKHIWGCFKLGSKSKVKIIGFRGMLMGFLLGVAPPVEIGGCSCTVYTCMYLFVVSSFFWMYSAVQLYISIQLYSCTF